MGRIFGAQYNMPVERCQPAGAWRTIANSNGLWYNVGTMTTIRTFVAIELSDPARTALTELQHHLRAGTPAHNVRWTATENIHLTLHFLGDTDLNKISKIEEILQLTAAAYSPFSLALAGLGCFPNTRRPRIVWVGVTGDTNSLAALHHDLGERLKGKIGFKPEARPYAPHLTIGRVKKGIPPGHLSQIGENIEREQTGVGPLAALQVAEISLIKSELMSTGPVYTPLLKGFLKGSTDV